MQKAAEEMEEQFRKFNRTNLLMGEWRQIGAGDTVQKREEEKKIIQKVKETKTEIKTE